MKSQDPLFPPLELHYSVEHNNRRHEVSVPPSHLFYQLFLAIVDIHKPNGQPLTQRSASEKLDLFYQLVDELIESIEAKPYLISDDEQLYRLTALKNNISRALIFLDDEGLKKSEHLSFYRKLEKLVAAFQKHTKLKTKKSLFNTVMFDWRCGLNECFGNYYLDHGQLIIAEGYFTASLEEIKNVRGSIDAIMNFSKWYNLISLAAISFARNRHLDAEYLYQKSMDLYDDNGPLVDKPLHRLNILYDLALYHEKKQDLEHALFLYRQALVINNRFLNNQFVKLQPNFIRSILTQVVAIRKKIAVIEPELKTVEVSEKKHDQSPKRLQKTEHIKAPEAKSPVKSMIEDDTTSEDDYVGPFEVEESSVSFKKLATAGRPKMGPKIKPSPVTTVKKIDVPPAAITENRFAHLDYLMTRVTNPHNEKAIYLAFLNTVFVRESLSKIHGAYECVLQIFKTCKFVGQYGQGIKYVKSDPKIEGTDYTLKIKPSGKYGDRFRIFGRILKDSQTPRLEVAQIMFDGVDLNPHGPGKIITP